MTTPLPTSQQTSSDPTASNRRLVELPLASITVDQSVQIRRNNREEAIQRYIDNIDVLPPVVAYELVDEGGRKLLSDGFHRHSAHIRAGRTTIMVELRQGTREQALEYAVVANARSGEPLTSDERNDGIRRLRSLHPDWEQQQIAKIMSASTYSVSRALTIQDVRKEVVSRKLQRIPEGYLFEVAPAPKAHWEPLLEAADKRGWTREGVGQAVRNLADPNLSDKHKKRLLSGEADPVEKAGDDTLQVPLHFLTRKAVKTRPAVPADPVGPDVAERLQPVTVAIVLSYYLPSGKLRKRGLKEYPRESELVERSYQVVVNHDALDGFGDARDPQSKGLVMLLRQINRDLWKKLNSEGWPRQENLGESVRPGATI